MQTPGTFSRVDLLGYPSKMRDLRATNKLAQLARAVYLKADSHGKMKISAIKAKVVLQYILNYSIQACYSQTLLLIGHNINKK